MSFSLAPAFDQQFFDNNGDPLVNGFVYTYLANTTTPQATYTDVSGDTENQNPVPLDASGRASIWLDVELSYKFILADADDNPIKTVDNVIGLLTNNSVPTAALQDDSVTQDKIADDAVGADQLADDASVDANRAVTSNHIRSNAILRRMLNSSGAIIPPVARNYLSGSGTHYKSFAFIYTGPPSVAPTAGATYTNNGVTFTVVAAIQNGNVYVVYGWGNGTPLSAGTLTKAGGTGDASIVYTDAIAPNWLQVTCVGGGGGGAGSGTSAGGTPANGGTTTFGSIVSSPGGGFGQFGGPGVPGLAPTITAPAIKVIGLPGGAGGASSQFAASTTIIASGQGGNSILGGGAGGVYGLLSGLDGSANTGGGASGGGVSTAGSTVVTGGGGAGGSGAVVIIPNPDASYAYSVGIAGPAGGAGIAGANGGLGAAGIIIVEEHFQ